MQNHQRMFKKLVNVWIVLGILLFSSISYSDDKLPQTKIVPSDSVCFTPDNSSKLVVDLEKEKVIEKINSLLNQQTEQLLQQTEIYKQQVQVLNDKFKAAEELYNKNEEMYSIKVKALEQDLEQAKKPRWGSIGTSFGLGGLLVLILTVL